MTLSPFRCPLMSRPGGMHADEARINHRMDVHVAESL